ncbi:MAG: hypothetical protein FJ090_22885, partial [Deltaproteobacteria bacterium]|nr:hypothetical protein [Deltaproteobacteria bacterium]
MALLYPLPAVLVLLSACRVEDEVVVKAKNTAPTAPTVSIGPVSPRTGDDLVAVVDAASEDEQGDAVTYTYAWKQDGLPRPDLATETVPAAETAKGELWEVTVTPNDGEDDGDAGSASTTILNTAPAAPVVHIGPEGARTADDLVVVVDTPSEDADGDAVTYTYVWTQNGRERADLLTDTVPASETTKGEFWEVTVTPTDGADAGDEATASLTILNTAPEATVAFSPEAPTTDDALLAVPSATDADGDDVSFAYAWSVDGADAGNSTDTVAAEATTHGQTWAVTVTPSDEEEAGTPVAAEVEIANSAPVMLSVTLVPDAPYVTEDIVAVAESSDADGDAVSYTYTWFVDGAEVQSGPSDTLASGGFAKHQRIGVEVVPSDGAAEGEAFLSADAIALNSLPTAGSAAIDPGTAYEASTLTCVPGGFADADGDAEGWTHAWSVNGTEVATTSTLDGASFSKGDSVTCAATPWDGEESGTAVTSAAITISNTAPVLAGVTLSTAAPTENDTLSATLGATSDDDGDTVTVSYEWFV